MPPRGRKRAKAGYMISAVAELYKLHPQTLRLYERVGLLKPSRSQGNTRLYTDQDLERLDVILTLARDMGVNLAGIEIILDMRDLNPHPLKANGAAPGCGTRPGCGKHKISLDCSGAGVGTGRSACAT